MTPYDFFECPKDAQKRDRVRWDICLSRKLLAMQTGKRSKCNSCEEPQKIVKRLVQEIL